jgi:hypothetical protein
MPYFDINDLLTCFELKEGEHFVYKSESLSLLSKWYPTKLTPSIDSYCFDTFKKKLSCYHAEGGGH